MLRSSWSLVAAVAGVLAAPAATLLAGSEDLDEVWEPFLVDAPID